MICIETEDVNLLNIELYSLFIQNNYLLTPYDNSVVVTFIISWSDYCQYSWGVIINIIFNHVL